MKIAISFRERSMVLNIKLYDTGTQINIVGPRLATAFCVWIHGNQTCIKLSLNPITSKTLCYLNVTVEIDGHSKNIRWCAACYLHYEIMIEKTHLTAHRIYVQEAKLIKHLPRK